MAEVVATPFGGSFSSPVYVTGAPGFPDLVYVVRAGRQGPRRRRRSAASTKPLIDVSKMIESGGEQGLLSTAFPPDFADSGLFYLYFTNRDCNDDTGGCNIEVAEFSIRGDNPTRAQRDSRRTVIEIPHRDAGNHNGGTATFGPDGNLWIATGDGGGGDDEFDNARKLDERLGKLLRINPKKPEGEADYRMPTGNPIRRREGPRRDLVDRPAQPLPLLVRRRRHRDRRRRPERARGGRHRPDR